MQCLRQTKALQELSNLSVLLALHLILLIDDLLNLILHLVLHSPHLRWHYVSQLVLYWYLPLHVLEDSFHFDEILAVWLWQLVNGCFSLEVDAGVFLESFVSQLNDLSELVVEVVLVVGWDSQNYGLTLLHHEGCSLEESTG